MDQYVIDSWAILALLQGEEPAATRMKQLFRSAAEGRSRLFMSLMNLGEVYYCVSRRKGHVEAEETLASTRQKPLALLPVTDEVVMAAARLKADYAISYADAFAVSAAQALDATLVSGDPELNKVQHLISIELLLRHPHTAVRS